MTDTVAGIASPATPLSITVNPGIAIAPITLPTGYVGSVYPAQGSSATLSASGGAGAPYAWSWTAAAGSSLPPGLGIGSATGTIGGTPTATGTYNVVVKATDSASPANSTTANLSITVNQGVTVTVPTLVAAYPGAAYASPSFTASGGTNAGFQWSWAAASGSSLPAGFSINSSTGVISAASPVNAGSANASYNAVVTATDSLGNKGTGNATIVIEASVSVTTTTLPGAVVGVAYTQQLMASGGSGTYTSWQVTSGASSLAVIGLSLNTSTGAITGPSPTSGTANFSVEATDSQGHVSPAANLSVTASTALTVTTGSLNPLDVGQTPTQTLAAAGGSGIVADYSWSWTAQAGSSLPPGLTLSTGGGLQGSPTTAGTYSVTVKVSDSGSSTSATANLPITIYSALSLPANSTLPAGYTGIGYSGTLAGSGGSGSYCYTVPTAAATFSGIWDGLSTGLPNSGPCGGATAPTNYGFYAGSSLAIGGTPTNPPAPPYAIAFNMTLVDSTTGASITRPYSISVTAPAAPSLPTPSSSVPGSATVGQNFNGSITATGGVGPNYNYTWTVNGSALTNNNSVSVGDGLSVVTSWQQRALDHRQSHQCLQLPGCPILGVGEGQCLWPDQRIRRHLHHPRQSGRLDGERAVHPAELLLQRQLEPACQLYGHAD